MKKYKTAGLKNELRKEERTCYIMLALPIIGVVVFTAYSILWALWVSLYSYTGIPSDTRFVGFSQYITAFGDATYWRTWLINILFALVKMPLEHTLGLITAYILMQNTKFAGVYRSVYYMPAIISVAIVGLIFSNLYDYFGVFNAWLKNLGLIEENVEWFSSFGTSFSTLVISMTWSSFGGSVIYYCAAIATVPKEVYESSDIDGAGPVTKIVRITVPMIAPMMQTLWLLAINGILHIGEYVLVLNNGAPSGTTYPVSAYLMSKIVAGYGELANIGYAAAISIITSIIFAGVGLAFNRFSEKMKNLY